MSRLRDSSGRFSGLAECTSRTMPAACFQRFRPEAVEAGNDGDRHYDARWRDGMRRGVTPEMAARCLVSAGDRSPAGYSPRSSRVNRLGAW
jgi:hypothetical protein